MHRRHGFGTGQRLGFEQLVHGELRRVFAGGGIETHQHLVAFGCGQNRHRVQGRGRRLLQRGDQVGQRGAHRVAHALHIQRGHPLYGERKPRAEVIDVQHQRVIAALFGTENVDPGGGERAGSRRVPGCAVAVVEQRAEQRQ